MSRGANPESYYGHSRFEMHRFVPAAARIILDIGCGSGAFAGGLKTAREGIVVWGVEKDPAAAARAREILDEVREGDVTAITPDLPRGFFDCICLNDILEHLVEPETLLGDLAPLLAPGGSVVASLPNVRYFWNLVNLLWRGRWEYTDEGICDRTHLRFFTRSSMRGMFERQGYAVRSCTGINPTRAKAFRVFNVMTLGGFSDTRYLQFALVAQPCPNVSAKHEKADPSP